MKRLIVWAMVLGLLLSGCGAADSVSETEGMGSHITLTLLQEERDFGGFVGSPCDDGKEAQALVWEVLGQYPAGFAD